MERLTVGDAELGILARMMRKVDFFAPLTVGDLETILPAIMLYSYGGGETVFAQGDKGDAFYIVYNGKVAVRVKAGWLGFNKTVKELGPGEFFGETALLSSDPRNATVRCVEPSQLFVLVSADFQTVLKRNPAAASEMHRISERRKFESKRPK